MEQTRFELGMEQLKQIDRAGGEAVIKSLEDIAPDIGRYIIAFAFGEIYPRGGLSLQEREMITITSLLTKNLCDAKVKYLAVSYRASKLKPLGSLPAEIKIFGTGTF